MVDMQWNKSVAAVLHWPLWNTSPLVTMQLNMRFSCVAHILNGGSYEAGRQQEVRRVFNRTNIRRHTFPWANFELFDVHGGAGPTCGNTRTLSDRLLRSRIRPRPLRCAMGERQAQAQASLTAAPVESRDLYPSTSRRHLDVGGSDLQASPEFHLWPLPPPRRRT